MARIRTIKPEFFTHPVYARLPDAAQVLALALLTHADDYGYFRADPELVRGALRPYWDSGKLRETFRVLLEAGWWVLRTHPEQGALGLIATWDKHQRVSHKTPSKIKRYWDKAISGNAPELLRSEQGTGNREQVGEHNAAAAPPTAAPLIRLERKDTASESQKNRLALARALRRNGLRATPDRADVPGTITEWADLMTGMGMCNTPDEVIRGIAWIMKHARAEGIAVEYAKHATKLAERWGDRLEMLRAKAEKAQGGPIDPGEGGQGGSEDSGAT